MEPVSPYFKLIFLTVVLLTVLCFGVAVGLGIAYPVDTPPTIDTMIKTFMQGGIGGLGAIFGLIGGKVA